MKKIIALLLGIAMIMTACASAPQDNTPANSESNPKGTVRYLETDPAAKQAWSELAQIYTKQTGIAVQIVTDQPTVFSFSGDTLPEQAMVLSDTPLAYQMTCQDLGLYDDSGKLKAIAYSYRSFGIIVNNALLTGAEFDPSQITDFAALKKIAEDIHSRAKKLGFDAFSSIGTEATEHLANMPLYHEICDNGNTDALTGTYLSNLRRIWDLCVHNAAPGDDAKADFLAGKTAFWLAGTWEYDNLVNAGITDVTMLPLYCGIEGEAQAGLCAQPERFWAINSHASEDDIRASMDFLYWVVTSPEGTQMLAQQYGAAPFPNAAFTENILQNDAIRLQKAGNYTVTLAYHHATDPVGWLAGLTKALSAYTADTTDANWNKVSRAFTDGWVS